MNHFNVSGLSQGDRKEIEKKRRKENKEWYFLIIKDQGMVQKNYMYFLYVSTIKLIFLLFYKSNSCGR